MFKPSRKADKTDGLTAAKKASAALNLWPHSRALFPAKGFGWMTHEKVTLRKLYFPHCVTSLQSARVHKRRSMTINLREGKEGKSKLPNGALRYRSKYRVGLLFVFLFYYYYFVFVSEYVSCFTLLKDFLLRSRKHGR